ncbi:Uncharacterised protein [Streptococcus pneumoniae]|nr:Uncharacterised protein [Streptococcus pneumoniae]
MPGAEKVKLTLQDGTVKEITPQADGSWSYTLGATEYLTQSFSGQFNGVFNQNKVKAVQVKDGVESEETTANVAPGQAKSQQHQMLPNWRFQIQLLIQRIKLSLK